MSEPKTGKVCTVCKIHKPYSEFYARPSRPNHPYQSQCKKCHKKILQKYYRTDKFRNCDKERDQNPERKMQRRAMLASFRAVKAGILIRPEFCEYPDCDVKEPLDRHHYLGYEKEHQLDVAWLCPIHHKRVHVAQEDHLFMPNKDRYHE